MDDTASELPFIRNLASSDRKLRTASLQSLQTHLTSLPSLSVPTARKLWKGLFYALWMTDRPAPQQRLAADLASLYTSLKPACVAVWFQAFWEVLAAQWTTGIDVLRLDKFLLLVRRVLAAHVRFAAARGYDCEDILEVLREYPFEKEGDLRKMPVGIRLHVLDIWIDELEREGALEDAAAQTFVRALGNRVEELKRCPVKPVRERAGESLEDGRLPWVDKEEESEEEDEEWGGIED